MAKYVFTLTGVTPANESAVAALIAGIPGASLTKSANGDYVLTVETDWSPGAVLTVLKRLPAGVTAHYHNTVVAAHSPSSTNTPTPTPTPSGLN